MKSSIAMIALLGMIAVAVSQKVSPRLDNVNIEAVLSNDRVLTNYIKCLLDQGACTREGRDLKRLLPDAIKTDCSQCSDAQKRNSRKVITYLRTRRPQDWKKLLDKFDPEGVFKKRIEAGQH